MFRFFACGSRHLPDADMHGEWPGQPPTPRSPQEPVAVAPVAKEPLPETPTPVGKPVTLTPQTTPAKTKSKPAPKNEKPKGGLTGRVATIAISVWGVALAGVVALSILEDKRYEASLKSPVDRVIAAETARRERLAARGQK